MAANQGLTRLEMDQARDMCKRSLRYLCRELLWKANPEKERLWDKIHDDIEIKLLKNSKRKLILVPRGHLKTAIITKGWVIQRLLVNPNARILIANQVWDKARQMLYEIKDQLTTKSYLPVLFGKFESTRWNVDEIVINQRTMALSAPTIGTTGVEAEMVSTHFDYIVADDLQGLTNCQTPDQREKVKKFYRSMLDIIEPDGVLVVVGTRWHMDDFYSDILNRHKRIYDIMVRQVYENGKIIFPQKFSKKWDPKKRMFNQADDDVSFDYINYLKKEHTTEEFNAQYLNNPVDEDSQVFKRSYFKYFFERPPLLFVAAALDPAISEKSYADASAVMVLGMDKEGRIYALDYISGKWSPSQTIDNLFQVQEKWKPVVFGLETVGFQRTYKLALEDEMSRRGKFFPIVEIRTGPTTSKEFRIKSLEPFYRDGKVFHAAWMQGKELESEYCEFPKGKHDDLIDAFAMCLPLLHRGGEDAKLPIPKGSWQDAADMARRDNKKFEHFFKIW